MPDSRACTTPRHTTWQVHARRGHPQTPVKGAVENHSRSRGCRYSVPYDYFGLADSADIALSLPMWRNAHPVCCEESLCSPAHDAARCYRTNFAVYTASTAPSLPAPVAAPAPKATDQADVLLPIVPPRSVVVREPDHGKIGNRFVSRDCLPFLVNGPQTDAKCGTSGSRKGM
ncbi:hypothetical protein BDV95DRAFT_591648 [Massariosphaeria phaeospora]|uniref:Uncharacterized protein n=1 Tax=Massariosphaeria phaeospora TaxID=100035 RepID=A0A7C8IAQ7_9PLEO|nr:hypothetical protein BDV95DRAFT_591648 [Massariosphaeria phaeospora]